MILHPRLDLGQGNETIWEFRFGFGRGKNRLRPTPFSCLITAEVVKVKSVNKSYSLCLIKSVSFEYFLCFKINVLLEYQYNIYYFFLLLYPYVLTFTFFSTTLLSIINNDILVNYTNFIIKINTSNYFFKNRIKLE